jgi:hypothetical protein
VLINYAHQLIGLISASSDYSGSRVALKRRVTSLPMQLTLYFGFFSDFFPSYIAEGKLVGLYSGRSQPFSLRSLKLDIRPKGAEGPLVLCTYKPVSPMIGLCPLLRSYFPFLDARFSSVTLSGYVEYYHSLCPFTFHVCLSELLTAAPIDIETDLPFSAVYQHQKSSHAETC